jgi:hypothetical protein
MRRLLNTLGHHGLEAFGFGEDDHTAGAEDAVGFRGAKDRPILFTALAWADVLLTLDRNDFGALLGGASYGLSIHPRNVSRARACGRQSVGTAEMTVS